MKYKSAEFKITCDKGLMEIMRELVASAAGEAGFEAFEDTATGCVGYVQDNVFDKDALDKALDDALLPDTHVDYTIKDVEDKDWNATWESNHLAPITIDDRVVIFSKNTTEFLPSDDPSKIHVCIDAKQAFGTGLHETTQMVISTLLKMPVIGKRVLDCGCGTGILSIVASKLGAKEVVAYDIDEWSVNNTRHNAELNNVTNIDVYLGDAHILSHVSGVFDIVMANINRNILLHDMDIFQKVVVAGSLLIVSGFYEEDVPMLVDKGSSLGFQLVSDKSKDNWHCLMFQYVPKP